MLQNTPDLVDVKDFPLNREDLKLLIEYGADNVSALTRRLVNGIRMRIITTMVGGSASVVEFIYGEPLHLFLTIIFTAYSSYSFHHYQTTDEFHVFRTSEILHRFLFEHPESYQHYIDLTRDRYDSIHHLLVTLQSTFEELDSRLHISVR